MMIFSLKFKSLLGALLLVALLFPPQAHADEWREEAGMGIGMVIGNWIYLPLKASLVALALPQSLIALVTTAGDTEVAKQILQNGIEGPYLISPKVARTAIGKRPELEAQSATARGH